MAPVAFNVSFNFKTKVCDVECHSVIKCWPCFCLGIRFWRFFFPKCSVIFSCTCKNMEQYCCCCSDYWGSERYIGLNNVRVCVFPFHWGLCEKQPVYNGRHWDCYPPHSSFTHTSSFKGSLANFPLFMDHLISPYRASPISCVHWTHHKRADNYSLHRNNWKHSLSRV